MLKTLEEEIMYALKEGAAVELGDLCDFYPTVSGPGADAPDTSNPAVNITKKSIRIRAKSNLNKQIADVSLTRES